MPKRVGSWIKRWKRKHILHCANIYIYIYIYIYIHTRHTLRDHRTDFIYIYIYIYVCVCVCVRVCVCMYIYVIVGNCSKCCWRVLSTHECRAKYSSKWLCVFHFSHFELYIYIYTCMCIYIYIYIYIYICICNNQVLSLCKFIKFINDSTKILNNKIPWWVSNHKTGLMKV